MTSKQRQIILESLKRLNSHPTVDELYPIIKLLMPSISLGTVYRNLNVLAEQGEILKLEYAGQKKRFDGNVKPHHHFRCISCQQVYDVPEIKPAAVSKICHQVAKHQVTGCDIEFHGTCVICQQKESHHG